MKVEKTTDYSMFKTIAGNRSVNNAHLKHLSESLSTKNMLEQNPILVNKKMEVIDGQHRLRVATTLGIPVYYTVVENADLNEVVMLNANSRQWGMNDYLESFIQRGHQDYQTLKDFMQNYELPLGVSARLLSGTQMKAHDLVKDFKNGRFEVKEQGYAEALAKTLVGLKPYVEGSLWRSRDFIGALQYAFGIVEPRVLIHKVKTSRNKVQPRGSVKDYLRQFEDIVNYRSRTEIRF